MGVKKQKQMSESLRLGIILAISGGFMDAYAYVCRGGVFANSQAVNLVWLGLRISEKNWASIPKYLVPILAFIGGIALSDRVEYRRKRGQGRRNLHWRQILLLVEIMLLVIVAFLPTGLNLLASGLLSFSYGVQIQCFRKVRGTQMATTICIGNFQNGTHFLCSGLYRRSIRELKKGILYYILIFFMIVGAIFGNFCNKRWGNRSIIVSVFLLVVAFFFMFQEWAYHRERKGVLPEQVDQR